MNVELRLSVEDSPNSAGIMIDMIRCAKIALENKKFGYLSAPSAYGFKHPFKQLTDVQASLAFKEFIGDE